MRGLAATVASTALTTFALAPAAGAQQTLLYDFAGDSAGEHLGFAVAGGGDFNADGYDDLIVGSQSDDDAATDAGSARVLSGRTGEELLRLDGDNEGDELGRGVDFVGDLDGDGYDEIIVSAPKADTLHQKDRGLARVYSGIDGTLFLEWIGAGANDRLGISARGAGDVDLDGVPDVIVGAFLSDAAALDAGEAFVFSGVDGAAIHSFSGVGMGDYFGFACDGAGDVNADGYADVIVGSHHTSTIGVFNGRARVFSGFDGATLYDVFGSIDGDRLGFSVSGVGDVDDDGHDDFAYGILRDDTIAVDAGSVVVRSGLDGSILHQWYGSAPFDEFGYAVSDGGDLDGDGHADVLVGATLEDSAGVDAGTVYLLSGGNGSTLDTFHGTAGDELGFSVAFAGDVNADGVTDCIAGAWHEDSAAGSNVGSAVVLSAAPLQLTASTHLAPLAAGETIEFSIAADPALAGNPYLLLGSGSGTTPGFALDGHVVPLNLPDVYFNFTVANANSPVLSNTFGIVGVDGTATAFFVLPPGTNPGLAGFQVDHAFLVFDVLTLFGQVAETSNSVPFTFVP